MNLVRLDLFAWIFPSPSSSGCPISVYYSRADSEALLLLGLFIFGITLSREHKLLRHCQLHGIPLVDTLIRRTHLYTR